MTIDPFPTVWNNHFFRTLIEASIEATLLVASDGKIKLVNYQIEKLFGYSREELIENQLQILLPGYLATSLINDDADCITSLISRLNTVNELKAFKKDGSEVPVEIKVMHIDSQTGNFFTVSVRDISEQKRIEQLLLQSENQFQLLGVKTAGQYPGLVEAGEKEATIAKLTAQLSIAQKELARHKDEKVKHTKELAIANEALSCFKNEKEKFNSELNDAIEKLADLKGEKEKHAAELLLGNNKLLLQIDEKDKRANELMHANADLKKSESDLKILICGLEQSVTAQTESVVKMLEEKNSIFDSIRDAFFAIDKKWIVNYWNLGAEENLNIKKNDIIGKNLWEFFSGSENTISYRNHHLAMQTKQPMHFEDFYPVLNTWYEINSYPSDNGMSIFFKDITARKDSERKLKESEERFKALIENNQGIISLTDDSLNIIYRSPSWGRITGWTQEDINATGGLIYFHPDDLITVQNSVAEAKKKPGLPQTYLARLLHKMGHYIWLEGTVFKLPDESIVKGIVFNTRDVTERIELEQLLHKANTLARIGGWEIDLIKGTVYWSDITKEIHEAEADFVPDLSTGINFYKEGPGRKLITKKVKEAIELGLPWDEELQIITAKNNERWIRTIGEAELIDGKCVRIYGSFQDIDQRKVAENLLSERENYLRLILQTEPECVKILGLNGELLSMNPAGLAMIEAESETQVLNQKMAVLIHSKYRGAFKKLTKSVFEGKSGTLEFEITGLKGRHCWLETHAVPLKDIEGKIISLLGVTRDITERKKAAEKIRLSEIRILKAQEIGKFGYWQQQLNSDVVWASKEAMHIYGFPAFEGYLHKGKIASCIIDQEKVKEAAANLIERNEEYNIEIRINPADGSPLKFISVKAEIEKNEHGEPMMIVGTLQDITERKTAEEILIKTNEELRTLSAHLQNVREEERMSIAREIHDELGQQLTGLKMDVSMLDRLWKPKNIKIDNSIKAVLELIDATVTSVRRISTNLRPGILDDLGLIAALEWQSREVEKRSAIEIKFKCNVSDTEIPFNITTGLFRIYQETLTNAVKHSNAHTVISELKVMPKKIILQVSDNGKGIDEKVIKANAMAERKTFGLLGIKERTYMLNGDINITSAPGRGTTIFVSIPL